MLGKIWEMSGNQHFSENQLLRRYVCRVYPQLSGYYNLGLHGQSAVSGDSARTDLLTVPAQGKAPAFFLWQRRSRKFCSQ